MAKPKPKSDEDKKAALDQMLSLAAITNHLEKPVSKQPESSSAAQPTLEPTTANPEQKGENDSVAPLGDAPTAVADKVSPAPVAEPIATPIPAVIATPAAVVPTPAPAAAPEHTAAAPTEPKASQQTNSNSEREIVTEVPTEKSSTVDEDLDLGGLFAPSTEKKTAHCRITNSHYQYFQLLGTIVGEGTSIPDIVHNIIADFIRKNDTKMQKALHKGMRKRQAALSSINKS